MAKRTIAVVAREAGVRVETVRYYQRRGLIAEPPKPAGAVRDYPAGTAERIRLIRRAQTLGFSLAEIADLLRLRDGADADAGEVRTLAEAKLAEIDAKIARLAALRRELGALVRHCPGQGTTGRCSVLAALEAPDNPAEPVA